MSTEDPVVTCMDCVRQIGVGARKVIREHDQKQAYQRQMDEMLPVSP